MTSISLLYEIPGAPLLLKNKLLLVNKKFQQILLANLTNSQLQKALFYLLQWKPFKNDRNAFYFFLEEAIFVVKTFQFLSWLFDHIGKWLDYFLVNKQLQYTFYSIFYNVKAVRAIFYKVNATCQMSNRTMFLPIILLV